MVERFKKSWINAGEFSDATIEFADDFGKRLVTEKLSNSQIRKLYSEVKRIQHGFTKATSDPQEFLNSKHWHDFLLLRPKMAYAAKKDKKGSVAVFKEVMDKAHQAVTEASRDNKKRPHIKKVFKNFCDFFEAILAYHRSYGE